MKVTRQRSNTKIMNTVNKPIFNDLLFIVQTRKSLSHFNSLKFQSFKLASFRSQQ